MRHRGYAAGVPAEVRVGPGEVDARLRLAAAFGFSRSATISRELAPARRRSARRARPGLDDGLPGDVATRLASADLSPLGVQRERFKRERRDVLDALTRGGGPGRGASRAGSAW